MSITLKAGENSSWLSMLNDYSGLLSLITAIFSILIALIVHLSQKRHNQLSVLPIPYIANSDYEERIRVRVYNNGNGPLIIKKLYFVKDEVLYRKPLVEIMPEIPNGLLWEYFSSEIENRPVEVQSRVTLLSLAGDRKRRDFDKFVDFRDQCRKFLKDIEVVVEYTDIYGRSFEPVRRRLTWFGRHEPSGTERPDAASNQKKNK